MDAIRQAQVAFFLTGKRLGAELEPVEGLGLRPALMARYRNLEALRYDYPIVLLEGAGPSGCVRALSGLVDDALRELAAGEDAERLCKQVLGLEGGLREVVAGAGGGRLSELWTAAGRLVGTGDDESLRRNLERAQAALPGDGMVVDCDASLPVKLLGHVWRAVQDRKAARLRHDIERLAQKVSDILRADFARSVGGRSAETLRASVGGEDQDAIDFNALSRVLARTANRSTLSETRRRRLEQITTALGACDFEPGSYRYASCVEALGAWRERYPVITGVARAIAMAELEIAGDYREARHDPFFEEYGADGLAPEDVALFPDYLVCVNAAAMDAAEQAALMEILSSGLPMKVLVQADDLAAAATPATAGTGFGRSAPHLANMAIGLNEVFVMQTPASHLLRVHDTIVAGMGYPGTALFSIFSGASDVTGDVPPYLVAAAAAESRAFPLFTYDPSAGDDWATRFTLAANPQPEADWPIHVLEYEDAERSRVEEPAAFTYADFAALDGRNARHLALLPAEHNGRTITVSEAVAGGPVADTERLPVIPLVDRADRLCRALVDEKLLRETRRCREAWHSLQELGGIHNSYAARSLAEARPAREDAPATELAAPAEETPAEVAAKVAETSAVPEPEDAGAPGHDPDEAWIETALCTTCNECTGINDKMFAYNENRQAYIADPDAGSYAQLVEAAESCQVSIIHPGKPRNPDEPGLAELVSRAEPFL